MQFLQSEDSSKFSTLAKHKVHKFTYSVKSAQLILKRLIQVCSCIVAVTDSETLKKALIILCAWILIKKNVYRPQVDFSVSDLACKILHPKNRQPDICLTSRQCADDNTANLQ